MLKEIFLEGNRWYYLIGNESDATWFYKGENTKLRREFYLFGKWVRIPKHWNNDASFIVYLNIESKNFSKEEMYNFILKELHEYEKLENRKEEIKNDQII
jgi:hypothetical protein